MSGAHIERAINSTWRDKYAYDKPVADTGESDEQRFQRALEIWRERKPLKGSPAEYYLRRRYIRPDIRLWPPEGWPELVAWSEDAVRTPKQAKPAMICAVNDASTGLVVGLQRLYFGRDGNPVIRPDGKKDRKSLGRIWGNAAMLSPWPDPEGRWGCAEGLESALAATLLTRIPTWSAVNAGNMAQLRPPIWARHVTIFADHDEEATGMKRAVEALDAWRGRPGIESVRILTHKRVGGDVADALMEAPYA